MKISFAFLICTLLGTGCSTTPTHHDEVVYIYEEGREIKSISAKQDRLVREKTSQFVTENRKLWFVLVAESDVMLNATIYFMPENSTGRIHNGSMYTFPFFNWMLADATPLEDTLETYYFAQTDEGATLSLPTLENLPFSIDGNFSEKIILEIVEFTQPLLNEKDGSIISIRAKGSDVIEVKTAKDRRPLAGRGSIFTIVMKHGELSLISKHFWVS